MKCLVVILINFDQDQLNTISIVKKIRLIKLRTFSSCFMRETRIALVVLVRSLGGIFNPRSIAYNRPKFTKKNR